MTAYTLFMCGLVALFCGKDMSLSARRITKYGINIEMNPLIRWCIKELGVWKGLVLGLGIPDALIIALSLAFDAQRWISFYAGFRTCLFIFQLASERVGTKV